MIRTVIFAACALLAATPAIARPLDARDVPDRAQVVVHVDLDALRTSQLRTIFAKNLNESMAEIEGELSGAGVPFTLDDVANAGGVTFWAEGDDDERGALIVKGVNGKKLLANLKKSDKHRRVTHQGKALHRFEHGGEAAYIALSGAVAVIADDADSVARTLDTMAGKARSLARSPKAAKLGQTRGVLFAAVFEERIADKIRRNASSSLFKDVELKSGLVYARETARELVTHAVIETNDAAGANQLHRLAAGAIAFLDVASDDKDLARLLDAVDIQSRGNQVTFTLSLPFATIRSIAPGLGVGRHEPGPRPHDAPEDSSTAAVEALADDAEQGLRYVLRVSGLPAGSR